MSGTTQTDSRRQGLSYASVDDVIADVQRLRRGYTKTANWDLPATCWHLEMATRSRMVPGPFPPNTPEQDARAPRLKEILATGKLPSGIDAPAPAIPSANTDESAIDALIETLKNWDAYSGPIAPHRLFGHMPEPDIRKLNLIHCAHHLSYLVPAS